MDFSLSECLIIQLDARCADEAVRVLIIRSEGRGFCAGVDIKELDAHPELIAAANELGIAMIFTGQRQFRH